MEFTSSLIVDAFISKIFDRPGPSVWSVILYTSPSSLLLLLNLIHLRPWGQRTLQHHHHKRILKVIVTDVNHLLLSSPLGQRTLQLHYHHQCILKVILWYQPHTIHSSKQKHFNTEQTIQLQFVWRLEFTNCVGCLNWLDVLFHQPVATHCMVWRLSAQR